MPVSAHEGDTHLRVAVKSETGSVVRAGTQAARARPGQAEPLARLSPRDPGSCAGCRAGVCRPWRHAARTGLPWRGSGTQAPPAEKGGRALGGSPAIGSLGFPPGRRAG